MISRSFSFLVRTLFLVVVGVACLGPVLWVLLSSFKTNEQVFGAGSLLPDPFTIDGYIALFTQINILPYLTNTLVYAVGGALGATVVGFLAAYPVARLRFPFRASLGVIFSIAIAIPIAGLIVPEFVVMQKIALFDTQIGMILFYSAIGFPLSFVIFRSQLASLPASLEEAAALDGANYFQLLRSIILPLARPGFATAGVLTFVNVFNDFLFNLLLAPSIENQNMQVGLTLFRGQFSTDITPILAGTAVVMVIPAVTFIVLQRYVIAGFTAGAVR